MVYFRYNSSVQYIDVRFWYVYERFWAPFIVKFYFGHILGPKSGANEYLVGKIS